MEADSRAREQRDVEVLLHHRHRPGGRQPGHRDRHLFTVDGEWTEWSEARLAEAFDAGHVGINPIVYAEISVAFERIETLEAALPEQLGREALPWQAAFLAGKCSIEYRRRGGARRSPLSDFYIGAHAAVTGRALLTRDANRYRTLLPTLALITP